MSIRRLSGVGLIAAGLTAFACSSSEAPPALDAGLDASAAVRGDAAVTASSSSGSSGSSSGTTTSSSGGVPSGGFSGEGTYTKLDGTSACGNLKPGEVLVVALNKAQYQKSLCGKCVHVKGPKGEVTVRITDLCPSCKMGDLDLSEQAFQKIAEPVAGRVPISWEFVACP
jgi:expansin